MKKIWLFLFGFIFSLSLKSQTTYDKLYRPGFINSTVLAADGYIYGAGRWDYSSYGVNFIKQTVSGQLIWHKYFDILSSDLWVEKMKETAGGNFLILGADTIATFLMKVDSSGNILFAKRYFSSLSIGNSMELDNEGNIYISGINFNLIKLDSLGNLLWAKKYSNDMAPTYADEDKLGSIVFRNGRLIVQGTSRKELQFTLYYPTYTLHTLDTAGNLISNLVFSDTISNYCGPYPGEAIPIDNSQIIYTATYWSSSANYLEQVVMKIDTTGQIFWRNNFRVALSVPEVNALVFNNADIYHVFSPQNVTEGDLVLLKMNSSGNIVWAKKYGQTNIWARPCNLLITPDNGIIMSGEKHYFNDQVFFQKVDSSGNWICSTYPVNLISPSQYNPSLDASNTYTASSFTVAVNSFTAASYSSTYFWNTCFTTDIENTLDNNSFWLSPNPATNELVVKSSESIDKGEIEIYDVFGKKVYAQPLKPQTVKVSQLPSGIYFVWVKTDKGTSTAKFVKE